MVMKVGQFQPVTFKSVSTCAPEVRSGTQTSSITELCKMTPSFGVQIPQQYKKLGITQLPNGLEIHSYKLANGHRISIIPMENSPAVVKNYVNVGSLNENDNIKGISHFLEHMAFNGTNGSEGYEKLNIGDSFKKIEKLGGWTNASTNYALTDYVNSSPLLADKDLEEQLKVIAAMTEDLALTNEMIEKEKGPVCSEINMIMDDPQVIALDQTVRTLFNIRSSSDELVAGSVNHIKNLTREDVKNYYDTYYIPSNMNLVITGNINPDETIELVAKHFKSRKKPIQQPYEEKITPIKNTVRKDFISDKASSTEIVLGFAGPKVNNSKEGVLQDITEEYLATMEAGLYKPLKDLNSSFGCSTEKISTNTNNPTLIYYGITCNEEYSEKALKTVLEKLSSIKAPSEKTLINLKIKLAQEYNNALEHSRVVNDIIGNCINNNCLDQAVNYKEILANITAQDIENYVKKYLNPEKAAITIVHPEIMSETLTRNHNEANSINFKGKINRKPIDTEQVFTQKLDNNFETAFVESKNNNLYYGIKLTYNKLLPQDTNPAARAVLNEIYSMGTINLDEDSFSEYLEDNNMNIGASASATGYTIKASCTSNDFEKCIDKTFELLYEPAITQENINTAVSRIKDRLNRSQDSSNSLLCDYEAQFNPIYTSKSQILNNIDKITVEDLEILHQNILNNSKGTICMNIPNTDKNLKELAIEKFSELHNVKPNTYKVLNIYTENTQPRVITKSRPVSQADIMQTYKFEIEDTIKETTTAKIMNSLLSSSHSIGLFNTLREKEHLAYSVYSDISKTGNLGVISCNILTTTDNKEIGEISYDNLQKSIDGFHRQINKLLNSEYTDEDFEIAKRSLKASLLNKEGITSKLSAVSKGINSAEGIEYTNKCFEIIDSITREDIDNFAKKVFQNPPIYTIVASQDTINSNKDYLQSLVNCTDCVESF